MASPPDMALQEKLRRNAGIYKTLFFLTLAVSIALGAALGYFAASYQAAQTEVQRLSRQNHELADSLKREKESLSGIKSVVKGVREIITGEPEAETSPPDTEAR